MNPKASGSNSPSGIENCKKQLTGYFPGEAAAIDRYFEKVLSVCSRTPSLNIYDNEIAHPNLDEDYISLDAVLKDLTANAVLRGLLSGYAMCYGVRPSEMSFANHSRMVLNFYESICPRERRRRCLYQGVSGKSSKHTTWISAAGARSRNWRTSQGSKVGRFVLNTGEEVSARYLRVHDPPERDIEHVAARTISARRSRAALRHSNHRPASFRSLQRSSRGAGTRIRKHQFVSLFPDADVNKLLRSCIPRSARPGHHQIAGLDPGRRGDQGICILEPSFSEQVSGWSRYPERKEAPGVSRLQKGAR